MRREFSSDLAEGWQGDPRDEQQIPLQLGRQYVLRVWHQDVYSQRRRPILGTRDRPKGRDELGIRPQRRQRRRTVKRILVPDYTSIIAVRPSRGVYSDAILREGHADLRPEPRISFFLRREYTPFTPRTRTLDVDVESPPIGRFHAFYWPFSFRET